LVPGHAGLAQPDGDLHDGLVQVQRVGVALRAVAKDGDLLALDERKVGVFVVIHFHCRPYTLRIRLPRPMPLAPVRTVSRIALWSSAWMKASSFAPSPVSSMV